VILRPGTRLRSQVDATEVIVVRSAVGEVELTCGGHPMVDPRDVPAGGLTPQPGEPVALGKRYVVDGRDDLELLAVKAGECGVAVDGVAVVAKSATPLPASD
jgi:hypothetical protein